MSKPTKVACGWYTPTCGGGPSLSSEACDLFLMWGNLGLMT